MMTIFELWDQWCELVRRHNEKIDYSNQEETWYPYYIFFPFLYGIIIATIGNIVLQSYKINNTDFLLLIFLFSTSFIGLLMWINWILNE